MHDVDMCPPQPDRAEGRTDACDPLLTGVFDSIAAHMAVVDALGVIVRVNVAWVRFGAGRGGPADAESWIGVNYLAACGGPGGDEAAVAGITGVLEGRAAAFSLEYPCHGEEQRRWFVMHVSPLAGDGGVAGAAIVHNDVSASKLTELDFERSAMHDALTELPNRAGFDQAISGSGPGEIAGMIFIDVDRLKHVNDSLGHRAGDRLLSEVGARLRSAVGGRELVARLGGDEFAIITRAARDPEQIVAVARRVQAAFGLPLDLGDYHLIQATVSVGVAIAGVDQVAAPTLLRDADAAMYCAKRQGRGHVVVFDPAMRSGKVDDLALETALSGAAARDELRILYQRQCALPTGETVGQEALVRWQRPGLGLVMPDSFIPAAEDSEMIDALGGWVLQRACADAAARKDSEFRGAWVSVNVSARQLATPALGADVTHALSVSGLDPSDLILEITEPAVFQPNRPARSSSNCETWVSASP